MTESMSFSLSLYLLLFSVLPSLLQASDALEFSEYLGHWEVDFSASEHPNDKLRYLYDVTLSDHQRRMASGQNRIGETPLQAMDDLRGLVNLGRLGEQITRTSVLNVRMQGNTLYVDRDDNFSLRCEVGGIAEEAENLGYSRCRMSDRALVFWLGLPGGFGIEHRLILSERGDRLSIATTVAADGISQAFSVSRVYQPFEPVTEGIRCQYTLGKGKVCTLNGGFND
jgi:hypothetical protein